MENPLKGMVPSAQQGHGENQEGNRSFSDPLTETLRAKIAPIMEGFLSNPESSTLDLRNLGEFLSRTAYTENSALHYIDGNGEQIR